MNKYLSEIFAEFTYADSMSYSDLLICENMLMENLEGIFKDGGAEHLDFTPLGDMLMSQCALEIRNLEILRDIAQEIAIILPKNIRCRILCLQKSLDTYDMFWIERGKWSEKQYSLSQLPPEGVKINLLKVNEDKPEDL